MSPKTQPNRELKLLFKNFENLFEMAGAHRDSVLRTIRLLNEHDSKGCAETFLAIAEWSCSSRMP